MGDGQDGTGGQGWQVMRPTCGPRAAQRACWAVPLEPAHALRDQGASLMPGPAAMPWQLACTEEMVARTHERLGDARLFAPARGGTPRAKQQAQRLAFRNVCSISRASAVCSDAMPVMLQGGRAAWLATTITNHKLTPASAAKAAAAVSVTVPHPCRSSVVDHAIGKSHWKPLEVLPRDLTCRPFPPPAAPAPQPHSAPSRWHACLLLQQAQGGRSCGATLDPSTCPLQATPSATTVT